MKNNRIFLSLGEQSGSEQRYVQEALAGNWISTGGPHADLFEDRLESYLEDDLHVAALNSGTAAIHLALILLGVTVGDEVICQSLTFSASANPILYQGATPVFIDSEEDTWNMCPDHLERAIKHRMKKGKKPKAIIAVHLYGNPYKVDEIHAIADSYNIPVIEDSAEALGSLYRGKKCGTFGTFGIYSFNGNKIITTSGGGALISKTAAQKAKAIFYATQSKDEAVHYEHSHIGYNYRMGNICASVGLGQIEILEKNIEARKNMHSFYQEIFGGIAGVKVFDSSQDCSCSNHWLTSVLIEEDVVKKISREHLRLALERENIESRPLWKPMHLQPVFAGYSYFGSNIAQDLFEKGLCLPSGSSLTTEDKDRIREVIEKFFKQR
jgi:dTDP-4-amino-4,6-dideoxygalactose transaminase